MRRPEPAPTFEELIQRTRPEYPAAEAAKYQACVRDAQRGYHPWPLVKYRARAEGVDAGLLWLMVKQTRRAQYQHVPLEGERGGTLRFTVPALLQEELMLIDQQLAGRLLSPDERALAPTDRERFIVSSLREEAIASSMLEGAATTRRDAKAMLSSGRRPRTRGERMVLNNYRAMEHIRGHRDEPLTPGLLLHIQDVLTADTLDDPGESGRFRTGADTVEIADAYGNVLHRPPPAAELPARLRALCDFANGVTGADGFLHPVVRACILHFQLGFDHPFCDGNGRTARAVFYWSMLRAGYWLFEYLAISRLIYEGPSKYARAFLHTETDEFDATYFLVYKAGIIGRARKDLAEYIRRKQAEMAEGRRVFESDHRLNHRQRDLIVRLLRDADLRVSIQDHMRRHTVAYATARSDLLNLAEWGYLAKDPTSGKRFEFGRGGRLDGG